MTWWMILIGAVVWLVLGVLGLHVFFAGQRHTGINPTRKDLVIGLFMVLLGIANLLGALVVYGLPFHSEWWNKEL